ncbi:SAM-dependent DNA methyltransferase [Fimbriimonadia bacterium ATM]|nr:MAG: SAM-dependent DNA methyltransferase [Armatimonadota bacterium]MBC6970660.1 SAM-dependent DNA methyltransferase [Armatimonadota bacterium]MCE7899605.1 SAM-dependent DNA methyltransferase [Armatimonadetes bacterium ATM1]MDL1927690.1 SAM-dependent DNA methyltransferase [Fimbriimonadia bacterium ATM]RIJ96382.1 MAG: hypothetical protein DCC45_06895 [Armatimonadota bacterium]
MPAKPKGARRSAKGSTALGFEAEIFKAADKLRMNIDAALYKHVVSGPIFLKHVGADSTDLDERTFEESFTRLRTELKAQFEESDQLQDQIARNLANFRH